MVCTHGVFVGEALEKLAAIPQIKEIVTTDTVDIPPEKRKSKLHILSVAPIFGNRTHFNYLRRSIADLYIFGQDKKMMK